MGLIALLSLFASFPYSAQAGTHSLTLQLLRTLPGRMGATAWVWALTWLPMKEQIALVK